MAYLARFYDPQDEELPQLLARNKTNSQDLSTRVSAILRSVQEEGDRALFRFAKQFDQVDLSELRVTEKEIQEAELKLSDDLKKALAVAYHNIHAFHSEQLCRPETLSVAPGIELSRKIVPLQRVGLYIPGGTAPLFSTTLMLAIPSQVAACPSVVLCTPPDKEGKVHPAILYAASLCKVKEIYKIGGSQAIAAMAYGTQSIKAVDKIFGPGNQYVTEAKIQVSSSCCAIDMPAGPSEVMVLASPASNPAFVASDLLSQAEHGRDSQAMLVVCADKKEGFAFLDKVEQAIEEQLATLGRQEYLLASLASSRALVHPFLTRCVDLANAYAPEHLIINMQDETIENQVAEQIVNAGSLFLGPYSCESAGDYASGTNHTLPTNGWARCYSGVSTDSYLKKITVQKVSKAGLENLAPTLFTMAEGEMLYAHKNAVAIRLGGKK